MNKSITQATQNDKQISKSIKRFFTWFHIFSALKASNAHKKKGIPVTKIFQGYLFLLIFLTEVCTWIWLQVVSKSSIISTCSSYHISEILALTIFSTRLRAIRAIRSIFSIRVTLSRRIISWMQNKSFIRSIFRNGPSDLQIRKPAVLLSGNGLNRIVFHFTPALFTMYPFSSFV